jgi:hypothetical protein
LIADVKEWERRMRLREFFSDQNEKEDVLTDDQKQYNFIADSDELLLVPLTRD